MNDKAILTRLAGRIVNQPLMIEPGKLDIILGVVGGRIGLQAPDGFMGPERSGQAGRARAEALERVAVVPVYGSLVHRTLGLDALSGLTSYNEIRAGFRAALEDAQAEAVVLDIDSPGGEVAGVFDLADEIRQAGGVKPVYAFVNEDAFSAAYAIASAAQQIFIPRTGRAGSIGVIAVHVDQSAFDAKEGFKYTPIFAGARKNDFSSHQPLTSETFFRIQEEINKVYGLFAETVAGYRPNLSASDVRATEAAVYQGQAAVDKGLADTVMSWDQALSTITDNFSRGGRIMAEAETLTQEQFRTQLEGLLTLPGMDADAALAELGYAPRPEEKPMDLDKIVAEAEKKGHKDTMATVTGILDLCLLAGTPEMAAGLLKEGASVEDARKRILDYKAAQDGRDEIVSTVGPTSTGEVNPLLADARKRRDTAGKR